jgi:hypothetical protein
MNPKESSEISVQTLLALRQGNDALRVITEKLRVKEMGPADHIRTKHEVKAFIETGELTAGEALLKNVSKRRAEKQVAAQDVSQRQQRRI